MTNPDIQRPAKITPDIQIGEMNPLIFVRGVLNVPKTVDREMEAESLAESLKIPLDRRGKRMFECGYTAGWYQRQIVEQSDALSKRENKNAKAIVLGEIYQANDLINRPWNRRRSTELLSIYFHAKKMGEIKFNPGLDTSDTQLSSLAQGLSDILRFSSSR